MKKFLLVMAMLTVTTSAYANEELPLDSGIVVDISNGVEEIVPTVEQVEIVDTTVPDENVVIEVPEAAAADGTVLPIDEGDVNVVEQGTEEVVPVKEDTVTLAPSEPAPVVEPLAQTGIEDYTLWMLAGIVLAASGVLLFTRKKQTT